MRYILLAVVLSTFLVGIANAEDVNVSLPFYWSQFDNTFPIQFFPTNSTNLYGAIYTNCTGALGNGTLLGCVGLANPANLSNTTNTIITTQGGGGENNTISWKSNGNGTVAMNARFTYGSANPVRLMKNDVQLDLVSCPCSNSLLSATTTAVAGDVFKFVLPTGDVGVLSNPYLYLSPFNYSNSFSVYPRDELNSSTIQIYSLTISNGTNTTTYSNLNVSTNVSGIFNKLQSEIPSGNLTITVSSPICLSGVTYPRQYYADPTSQSIVNAYLLCDGSSPLFVRFNVIDSTQRPLGNASILIYKFIGTQTQLVTSLITGADGTAAAYLQTLGAYTLVASKQGYDSYSEAFSATSSSKIIILNQVNNTATITSPLTGISFIESPSVLSVPNSSSVQFGFNVSTNGTSTVDWFLMQIYTNGALIFSYNNTNQLGGNITAFISTVNASSGVTVFYNISRAGFGQFNDSQTYVVTNQNASLFNQSAAGARQYLGNASVGRFTRAIVALSVTALISAAIAPFNTYAAGGAALLSIAYFSSQPDTFVKSSGGGFLPLSGYASQWALFVLVALFVIGVVVLRWGV